MAFDVHIEGIVMVARAETVSRLVCLFGLVSRFVVCLV